VAARRNATSTTAGILRPDEFARHARVERLACSPDLAPWVENHWVLTWDLPDGTRYSSQTLPHPACNVSVELGHHREGVGEDPVVITGVVSRRFDVTTAGSGWVLGVKFRPGGLAALIGGDASEWTDRTLPALGALPAAVVDSLRLIGAGTPAAEAAAQADEALLPLAGAEPDAAYDTVLTLVADMLEDRSLLRVADVAARHDLPRRRLERLFSKYVGVGAKWVLARYRMHDVLSALDGGYDGTLADLAATYGWYDQAHFSRDFVALVGVTPQDYRSE
jgi:AraC-like DNA-binding protein